MDVDNSIMHKCIKKPIRHIGRYSAYSAMCIDKVTCRAGWHYTRPRRCKWAVDDWPFSLNLKKIIGAFFPFYSQPNGKIATEYNF